MQTIKENLLYPICLLRKWQKQIMFDKKFHIKFRRDNKKITLNSIGFNNVSRTPCLYQIIYAIDTWQMKENWKKRSRRKEKSPLTNAVYVVVHFLTGQNMKAIRIVCMRKSSRFEHFLLAFLFVCSHGSKKQNTPRLIWGIYQVVWIQLKIIR